jgi:hypothetical protein
MSYRISILDKSPLADGETASQALARTLTLVPQVDVWAIIASGLPINSRNWTASCRKRVQKTSIQCWLRPYLPSARMAFRYFRH